ncbi:hypothetical protein L914_16695, partial [Phytophthora nicotianae]
MTGLIAKQFPPEVLRAGDLIEYYSRRFVVGDPRGLRVAVVQAIDDGPGTPFPVKLDTEEPLLGDNLLRRRRDSSGKKLGIEKEVKWRKLRSYKLEAGTIRRPTHTTTLGERLSAAVDAAMADVHVLLRGGCEDLTATGSDVQENLSPPLEMALTKKKSPSTAGTALRSTSSGAMQPQTTMEHDWSEEICAQEAGDAETAQNQCRDAASKKKPSRSSETASTPSPSTEATHGSSEEPCASEEIGEPPTDTELLAAQAYANTVPTRWMRKKIRHQAKETAYTWKQYRSRQHRYQAKCAITRSGNQIYHAHSLKAKRVKALLRLPGVMGKLKVLRERRQVYTTPTTTSRPLPAE